MRTHYCGELNSSFVGEEVELTGWVHKRRDHGGVIFLDIRDRSGIAQVVYDPDTEESFAVAIWFVTSSCCMRAGECVHDPTARLIPT